MKSPCWHRVSNLQTSDPDLLCLAAVPSLQDSAIFMAPHSQDWLTSVFEWELVFPTWHGPTSLSFSAPDQVPAPELQLPTETIPLKLVFQISRNQIKDSVQSKNFKASSGVLIPDLTNLKHDAQPLDTHDSTQAADSKPGGGFDFQASGFILCLHTS